MEEQRPRGSIIKNIYLYLVSFVALMMIIFSAADIINIVLRTYIFPKADNMSYYYGPVCTKPLPSPNATSTTGTKDEFGCANEEEQKKQQQEQNSAQKQRDLVRDLSMILVAAPVFTYHWRIVRRKEEGV
jgi:hypothetical protein